MRKKSSYIAISERKLLLRTLDVFVIILSLWIASVYGGFEYIDSESSMYNKWLVVFTLYFWLFGEIFQLYNLRVSSSRYLVLRSIFITAFITTMAYLSSPFITPSLPENRFQIVYFLCLIIIPVIIWRFLYMWLLFSPKYFKTIIVIGHSSKAEKLLNLIRYKNFHNIFTYISDSEIAGFSNFKDVKGINILKLIKQNSVTELVVSTEVFSPEIVQNINDQLIQSFEKGINIKSFETYYEEVTGRIPKENLDHNFYKNINFSKNNNNQFYLFAHRVIDILISLLGILAFIGILPLILVGNLIGNRGSIFYFQERVGEKGKIFKIIKLRSMVPNAEKNGAVWAKKDDLRITGFGKFLRNTRLDEFPQFYNIIKGDMGLIGPRPERPKFVSELKNKIPFYATRHVIRPGLTGWAQVKFPYANTIEEQEEKLLYDLFYIKERSSFLDFKILIKTFTTILFYRGQ
jgi:exopolysaccharide biosynthesis polyprenyl glycosylphosphotransferase